MANDILRDMQHRSETHSEDRSEGSSEHGRAPRHMVRQETLELVSKRRASR